MRVGFTMLVILVSRVQMTLLLGDITSALASADAERVCFEERLQSFKVRTPALRLRSHRHESEYEFTGLSLRVVRQSYKLHPHEWSVRGHLYKHITQRVSVDKYPLKSNRVNVLRKNNIPLHR